MKSRTPTVWIVNDAGHPYEKAETFGNTISLTEGAINPFKPDRLARVLASKLKESRQDDRLLLSGSPMVNALALVLWFQKHSKCNTLQWSFKYKRYELKTIQLRSLEEMMT